MKIKKKYQGALVGNKIVNTESDSQNDAYSCKYINDTVQNYNNLSNKPTIPTIVNTASNSQTDTYSCNYVDTQLDDKQKKFMTMTKSLTTDSSGNAYIGLSATEYIVVSIYQKGTTFNCWTSLYCYGNSYYIHTGNFNGTAASGTGTYEIVYYKR